MFPITTTQTHVISLSCAGLSAFIHHTTRWEISTKKKNQTHFPSINVVFDAKGNKTRKIEQNLGHEKVKILPGIPCCGNQLITN